MPGMNHVEVKPLRSHESDTPGFTPGPWLPHFEHREGSDQTSLRVTDCTESTVVCSKTLWSDTANKAQRAEHVANLHLIAAAPDLYAALAEMTERYAALDARLVAGQHSEPNGTIARARAALAKAGGAI